jgi:hypothetical protein
VGWPRYIDREGGGRATHRHSPSKGVVGAGPVGEYTIATGPQTRCHFSTRPIPATTGLQRRTWTPRRVTRGPSALGIGYLDDDRLLPMISGYGSPDPMQLLTALTTEHLTLHGARGHRPCASRWRERRSTCSRCPGCSWRRALGGVVKHLAWAKGPLARRQAPRPAASGGVVPPGVTRARTAGPAADARERDLRGRESQSRTPTVDIGVWNASDEALLAGFGTGDGDVAQGVRPTLPGTRVRARADHDPRPPGRPRSGTGHVPAGLALRRQL